MKSSLFLIGCVVCSPVLAANELPPILDYYPECAPQVINNPSDKVVYDIDSESEKTGGYLQLALVELQRKAQSVGADAVIIERINIGNIDRSINLENDTGKINSSVKKIHVLTTVQNIKLCDDKRLTTTPTPYNSKGLSISRTETVVMLPMLSDTNLLKQAEKFNAPQAIVTINSAYGIKLGDSSSQLFNLMGPHSVQLLLDNGSMAYSYGRNLWFFVNNDSVSNITQNQGLFNSHGKNQIALSGNYDNENWSIAGKIKRGDELQKVKQSLSLKPQQDDYVSIGDNSKLVLNFESYKQRESTDAIYRLNGFSILPLVSVNHSEQVKFASFSNIDIAKIVALKDLQTYKLTLPQLVNQIQLNQDGPLVLINPNILLGINNQGLVNKIKVTESVLGEQDINQFNQVLAQYDIPNTKSAFLDRYPNAEDNFDNILLNKDNISMSVNFDSYDDDAQLIELTLSF